MAAAEAKEVAAILRADLGQADLLLDDLEEVTSVEAAVIQEAGVDDQWDPEDVTAVMPETRVLQLREKCRRER